MTKQNSSMTCHRRLPPFAALRAFEAAARHLSFRRAADELAVTPTAVSHQIRLLEASLGMALFVRHVRRVSLTDAGQRLYPVLREGFDGFARAIADLQPASPRKAVTVTAPTLFTVRRLLPALGGFPAQKYGFDLRIHASDELVDLASGGADIAIRYASGPFDGLVTEPLLAERFGVLCSPRLGVTTPNDLQRATLLHTEWRRPGNAPDWPRWAHLAGIDYLDTAQGLRFSEDDHALKAAIAGHGAVITSLVLAAPEISAGLLVHPFGPVIDGERYHVAITPANMSCAEVMTVCDWLKRHVPPTDPVLELSRRRPA